MDAIERRARELIAAEILSAEPRDEYLADYYLTNPLAANTSIYKMVLRALTPPEGYVLVPLKMTKEIEDVLNESREFDYSAESTWDLAIHASGKFENVND